MFNIFQKMASYVEENCTTTPQAYVPESYREFYDEAENFR